MFGGGTFGQDSQQKPSLFGNFQQQQQQQQQPQQQLSLFGSSTQQSTNLFGSNAQQPTQQPSLFGGFQQQPQQQTSLFGTTSTAQPQTATSQSFGLFGQSTPVQAPSTANSLFGTPQQPAQQNNLFGTPNQAPSTPASIFGTPQQNQQRPNMFASTPISALNTQPQVTTALQPLGGLFGSTSQPSTTPLFGSTSQPSTTSLFGTSQPQQQQTSLFGSTTNQLTIQPQPLTGIFNAPSNQLPQSATNTQPLTKLLPIATSQPAKALQPTTSLFGASTAVSTVSTSLINTQQTSLFGASTTASTAPISLFTSTQPAQQQISLFGGPSQAATTPVLGALTTTSQPLTSLFGPSASQPVSTGANALSLGGTAPAAQSLFGPVQPGKSLVSSTPSLLPGIASSQQTPQQSVGNFNQSTLGKNSPLEQEVLTQFMQLLQSLRSKIKDNAEQTSKLESSSITGSTSLQDSMINASNFIKSVKANSESLFADAKDYVAKVANEACNCKTMIEIYKQKKLHPGQSSNQLGQLLLKISNNLHLKIEKLNDQVYELEFPLREYLDWKENGEKSKIVGKQELLQHTDRHVAICNLTMMNSISIESRVEQLKILYMAHLRQLHGKHVKCPFKFKDDEKRVELFEYDLQRGMKAPNIFPSTTALLSLVGSMQKPFGQQQSGIGAGFGQLAPQTGSIFGGFSQSQQRPFSLGGATATSSASGILPSSTSLFSKPLTLPTASVAPTNTVSPLFGAPASTTATKPAFQLPSVNTSAPPSFGSTLNSTSSGTLFGGSVTKTPTLFGAK